MHPPPASTPTTARPISTPPSPSTPSEDGLSAIADWDGWGRCHHPSVSAWRWWDQDAANDRDYTSVQVQTLQHIPSRQDQYARSCASPQTATNVVDYVAGLYWFSQEITGEPITAYGSQAAYWLIGPATGRHPVPNLLDGYFTDGSTALQINSYAAFGEANWRSSATALEPDRRPALYL